MCALLLAFLIFFFKRILVKLFKLQFYAKHDNSCIISLSLQLCFISNLVYKAFIHHFKREFIHLKKRILADLHDIFPVENWRNPHWLPPFCSLHKALIHRRPLSRSKQGGLEMGSVFSRFFLLLKSVFNANLVWHVLNSNTLF